jgi:hypothetical protein
MGSARRRVTAGGTVRYVALYRDARGRQRSAGTFTTEKQAERAWQRAEALLVVSTPGDPRADRIRFRRYVTEQRFPNHVLEPTTRGSYHYCLKKTSSPGSDP